jgi:hypothetical protein
MVTKPLKQHKTIISLFLLRVGGQIKQQGVGREIDSVLRFGKHVRNVSSRLDFRSCKNSGRSLMVSDKSFADCASPSARTTVDNLSCIKRNSTRSFHLSVSLFLPESPFRPKTLLFQPLAAQPASLQPQHCIQDQTTTPSDFGFPFFFCFF